MRGYVTALRLIRRSKTHVADRPTYPRGKTAPHSETCMIASSVSVVVHFLAIVFLRFSASAGLARRTSWWLKARRNYRQFSVFNLKPALHPMVAVNLAECFP